MRKAPLTVRGLSLGRTERVGLGSPVLVLNRGYQPVRITDARQGFSLLYMDRARALDAEYEPYDFEAWIARRPREDEERIGTARGGISVPRVLLLRHYSRVPKTPLRLSRRHVYLRDGHACQYCGAQPGEKGLNLDHVKPRSKGGRSTWENLVTSCRPCNLAKGQDSVAEAGMTLRSRPTRPSWSMALSLASQSRRFVEWEPFLVGVR